MGYFCCHISTCMSNQGATTYTQCLPAHPINSADPHYVVSTSIFIFCPFLKQVNIHLTWPDWWKPSSLRPLTSLEFYHGTSLDGHRPPATDALSHPAIIINAISPVRNFPCYFRLLCYNGCAECENEVRDLRHFKKPVH